MSIHLSDVGMLGATKRGSVKTRASSAQKRLTTATAPVKVVTAPVKVVSVAPVPVVAAPTPAMMPAASPAQAAAAAAGAPMPEAVKAPSSGAAPVVAVTQEQVAKFRGVVQFIEMDSLRALTAAAQKNEGVEIFATVPGKQRESDRLPAQLVKAVVSIAFEEIMRRGHSRPDASTGTVTQGGDSGQKTTELAVPGAPSTALMTPAQAAAAAEAATGRPMTPIPSVIPAMQAGTGTDSDTKLWVGLGVGALVLVGALAWMKSKKNKQASLPEQVQGWFDVPKRKRRKSRR